MASGHKHLWHPLLVPAGSASLGLTSGRWLLRGWAFRENSGAAAATVTITDAVKTGGAGPVIPIALTATESTRDFVPGEGIIMRAGVFVEIVGNVVGAVFVTPYDVEEGDET